MKNEISNPNFIDISFFVCTPLLIDSITLFTYEQPDFEENSLEN